MRGFCLASRMSDILPIWPISRHVEKRFSHLGTDLVRLLGQPWHIAVMMDCHSDISSENGRGHVCSDARGAGRGADSREALVFESGWRGATCHLGMERSDKGSQRIRAIE